MGGAHPALGANCSQRGATVSPTGGSSYQAVAAAATSGYLSEMSLVLQSLLVAEDLDRVRAELAALTWSSGKRTAGSAARDVKENLQADGSDGSRSFSPTLIAVHQSTARTRIVPVLD